MTDFTLTLDDLGSKKTGNIETLFAQANGFLGIRASDPILTEEATPGSFVNGFYESHEIIYGEMAYGYAKNHETMVKLFDLRTMEIKNDKEVFNQLMSKDLQVQMDKGILVEKYIYQTPSGKQIQIDIESFTSHAQSTVYTQRIILTAINFSGSVHFLKEAKHIEPLDTEEEDPRVREASIKMNVKGNKYTTLNSQLSLYTKFDVIDENIQLEEGKSQNFTAFYQISRDNSFEQCDYESLKNQQIQIFQDFWKISDIVIEGDEKLQKGIRVNLYHLFNSAGRDGYTNFGAKGLTGEGYEGHYFWDTEMYLLPFFTYTQPDIAKALLSYRLDKLELAKERAKELNFKGALFPWRGISGRETSAFFPAGTAQFHINADIVYAFKLYEDVTGDEAFIRQAKELIFETARFWLSFGFFSSRGFEIHEVTGPDEYTALVNNNYYTNKMVQNNLNYAVRLAERYNECTDEASEWKKAADAIYLGYDADKQITQQDDTFLDKEVWDFANTPKENYPLLLAYHPIKIYKHQVLKQADTILAHMLFGGDEKQIARDFDFYEPLTTHDSSLSRAIHGVVASRLGRDKQAYDFFADSATMDLSDMQGNAGHGIHAANMGGSWLGLIYGFANVHIENNELKYENCLPEQIKSMTFKVKFQGEIKEIKIGEK